MARIYDDGSGARTTLAHDESAEARPNLRHGLRGMTLAEQQATLTPPSNAAVQAKGQLGQGVHSAAADGVAGAGQSLPFLGQIQASFGRHDVSGIQAHKSRAASQACETIGAEAYATNGSVAFGKEPTLHTAAHEAAHVVQQRAGVALKGGVGESGDRYERHADDVADLVVQGKSAESLLDRMAGTGASADSATQCQAVQRRANNSPDAEKATQGGGRYQILVDRYATSVEAYDANPTPANREAAEKAAKSLQWAFKADVANKKVPTSSDMDDLLQARIALTLRTDPRVVNLTKAAELEETLLSTVRADSVAHYQFLAGRLSAKTSKPSSHRAKKASPKEAADTPNAATSADPKATKTPDAAGKSQAAGGASNAAEEFVATERFLTALKHINVHSRTIASFARTHKMAALGGQVAKFSAWCNTYAANIKVVGTSIAIATAICELGECIASADKTGMQKAAVTLEILGNAAVHRAMGTNPWTIAIDTALTLAVGPDWPSQLVKGIFTPRPAPIYPEGTGPIRSRDAPSSSTRKEKTKADRVYIRR